MGQAMIAKGKEALPHLSWEGFMSDVQRQKEQYKRGNISEHKALDLFTRL